MDSVGLRAAWLVVLVSAGCGRVGFAIGELGGDGPTGDDAPAGGDDAATGGDGGSGSGANIVFVASSLTDGGIGGLAQADDICAARAEEAGLAGTYVAYLSTTSVNAIDRLGSARGWV